MKPHKRLNAWVRSFELDQVTNSFPAVERFGLVAQIGLIKKLESEI